MNAESAAPSPTSADAARALLAFWRAAGVDMDEAEAIFTAAPAAAPGPAAARPPLSSGPKPAPKTASKPGKARLAPAPDAPVEAARALAAAADSVAALRAAVEAFEGCALKATARTTVFADGTETARVLLIGEAPGKEEDEAGKPFVGRSGRLQDRMLATIGLDRNINLLISNVIYWRPPGNRPPTQGELAACLPFVDRLIALARPDLLLLSGGVAAQTVLRRAEGVTKLRGRKLRFAPDENTPPVNVMVMLHPAYLLRRPQEKRLAWADMLLLADWLDELGVARGPSF
jgi:DNA polymerase